MTMYVETAGTEGAQPIVLLHGGGVAGWMWHPLRDQLSRSRRLIVPDLPGHGSSSDTPYRSHAETTRALIRPVHEAFLPGTVLALLDPASPRSAAAAIPLLEGKTLVAGAEAAYVCRNFACQAPVTTADALEKALALR